MITLTRLSGTKFALNCDLIERVDATPDTVVTLVDGKKYVVLESLDDVLTSVRRHRGEVLAMSTAIDLDMWARHNARPTHLGTVSEHPTARLGLTPVDTADEAEG
ncbi:flagellar protein FlbD [Nocardioides sp. Root1257]|uniref:flagellar FlbD family protein n=1 Tax=unclassified Nocardioides TaxID=2615069 RepID=UPI0006FA5844|nr:MULTISPECIES: flagellar FlbD family protein [unclassified Nocardioides]KQW42568.1 flagellar protein FlbD [Nocardioides sp. Root1257]KRC39826.1 flagellar protein FlbD [Nocardioides sp. Root224]